MSGKPNEETPAPLVPASYVPPGGTRRPVQTGETWVSIAASLSIDPWDLIDFNFPGLKRVQLADRQRATRQVNWYLREYVGCNSSKDHENWDFTSGLTGGKGGWTGGFIYTPPKSIPFKLVHTCSPTGGGKGLRGLRRTDTYRPLTVMEQNMVRRVFGPTLPHWDTIGIGDGLGYDGRPWTDMGPSPDAGMPQLYYQINIGDAAHTDLTTKALDLDCFVKGGTGTVADTLVHEMTHVWQYHNDRSRYGVWVSSLFGGYNTQVIEVTGPTTWRVKPKETTTWNDYDVEQQASIVEEWFHNGEKKTDAWYPFIRLVVRSGRLAYPRDLTLNELNRDLADLRARGLD